MKKRLSGIPSLGSWLLTFHVEFSLTTIDRTVNNTIRPALCQYDKPDNSARLSVFSRPLMHFTHLVTLTIQHLP